MKTSGVRDKQRAGLIIVRHQSRWLAAAMTMTRGEIVLFLAESLINLVSDASGSWAEFYWQQIADFIENDVRYRHFPYHDAIDAPKQCRVSLFVAPVITSTINDTAMIRRRISIVLPPRGY